MKYPKKLFMSIAVVLCFSLCIGSISYAETIKQYNETNYKCPISAKDFTSASRASVSMDSNGKIKLDLRGSGFYACVKYSSNGNKKIEKAKRKGGDYSVNKEFYGNQTYEIREKSVIVNTKNGKDIKHRKELVVRKKDGKIIKAIKLNVSKYLKEKKGSVSYNVARVKSKNIVWITYMHYNYSMTKGYGGIIELNIKTGKMKKIISTNEFVPTNYDGEYVYGYSFEPKGYRVTPEKVTFFTKSLKTKKTEKFTAPAISYDDEKYEIVTPMYTFYKGQIMGVEPDGKVYYGTFADKNFEQVGDISECKSFKTCHALDFAMKSKKEFYILYSPLMEKDEEIGTNHPRGRVYLAKYKG